MIRTLRRRHRGAIVLLSVMLPLLFVATLVARRAIPRSEPFVVGAQASAQVGPPLVTSWDGGSLQTMRTGSADDGRLQLSLQLLQDVKRPELLVYWATPSAAGSKRLPSGALLLGRLAGRHPVSVTLPGGAADTDGMLILYSLSQREIVTALDLPRAGTPGQSR